MAKQAKKTAPKSSPLTFVQQMRKTALRIKSNKDDYAEKAVSAVAHIRPGLQFQAARAKMMVDMSVQSIAVLDELLSNEKLRGGMTTLASNVIQDAGNRLNEAANVLEAMAKNEAIKGSVEKMEDAWGKYMEASKNLFGSESKRKRRRKGKKSKVTIERVFDGDIKDLAADEINELLGDELLPDGLREELEQRLKDLQREVQDAEESAASADQNPKEASSA